jgi:hypothetical protein
MSAFLEAYSATGTRSQVDVFLRALFWGTDEEGRLEPRKGRTHPDRRLPLEE